LGWRLAQPTPPWAYPEELGRLHYSNGLAIHVGQRLCQEIRPRPEVSIKDHDVVGGRPLKGVVEVAGLLVLAQVRAPDIGETECRSNLRRIVAGTVIEHKGLGMTGIRLDQVENSRPRVDEHFDGLAADGQEDVHAGISAWLPCLDTRLMLRQVETATREIYRKAQGLVGEIEHGIAGEPNHDGFADFHPRLRRDQAHRADTQGRGQERQRPPGIGGLLIIAWRMRKYHIGNPVPPSGRCG
jgi:hypothetical protein